MTRDEYCAGMTEAEKADFLGFAKENHRERLQQASHAARAKRVRENLERNSQKFISYLEN